jgi:hypothetical protein
VCYLQFYNSITKFFSLAPLCINSFWPDRCPEIVPYRLCITDLTFPIWLILTLALVDGWQAFLGRQQLERPSFFMYVVQHAAGLYNMRMAFECQSTF